VILLDAKKYHKLCGDSLYRTRIELRIGAFVLYNNQGGKEKGELYFC